jgi:two-component system, cell cycle response regulator
VAESLRSRMAALHFASGSDPVTLTCSFGVSQWQPGFSIDRLIKRADLALYKAKRSGRNRVVAADAVEMPASDARGGVTRAAERTSQA